MLLGQRWNCKEVISQFLLLPYRQGSSLLNMHVKGLLFESEQSRNISIGDSFLMK